MDPSTVLADLATFSFQIKTTTCIQVKTQKFKRKDSGKCRFIDGLIG